MVQSQSIKSTVYGILRRQVDATYLDFKKAFDLVDNDILLEKLSLMGFVTVLLKIFISYLIDRKQYVKCKNYHSDPYFTKSGVR